jgi:hypothetical protein
VERVADSVGLNPRARRARPAARLYREELDALQHVQVQVRGIARTLADEAARGGEIERRAADGSLTASGPLFHSTVAGSAAVAAADSAHAASRPAPLPPVDPGAPTRPAPAARVATEPTGPQPFLVAPPQELLEQLASLIEAVATALADFGAAAVDDEGRVGSPTAMHTLAEHLSGTRRSVREAIRTARAAELTPATWLVVGSILTDLRRMLGELEGGRDTPVDVTAYRPRRIPTRTPTLRRTSRPGRRGEE